MVTTAINTSARLLNTINTHTSYGTSGKKRKLIEFYGKLNGHTAKILIDTGAQSNFIDVSFVSQHNITQSSTQHSTSVHMADGTSYPVNSNVSDAIIEINDYADHITLDAIPLTAYDII